jgi:hypothetical protein
MTNSSTNTKPQQGQQQGQKNQSGTPRPDQSSEQRPSSQDRPAERKQNY